MSRDELRLHELRWQRTVASQMADAHGVIASVRLSGTSEDEAADQVLPVERLVEQGFLVCRRRSFTLSKDNSTQ